MSPILLMVVVPSMVLGICVGLFLRIRVWFAISMLLCANIILLYWLAVTAWKPSSSFNLTRRDQITSGFPLAVFAIITAADLGIALLVKLYRAAILSNVTPEERMAGAAGVRAWLSIRNMVIVVLFAAGASLGLDINFIGVLIIALCALLAYPLINTLLQPAPSLTTPPQAPAEERQRVLALVEAGKISAEDGAELLSALAQSQAAASDAPAVISGPRRVMLLGAAVTLVGFMMPWFTVNMSQQLRETASAMQRTFSQMPGMPPDGIRLMQAPTPGVEVPQITVHGGDLSNGLGWIMLAAALGAAGLPFFWPPRRGNALQQRNVIFAALIVGSIALLYLLSSSFNAITSIDLGFFFTMAGYALIWFGAIRNEAGRMPALQASPVIA